MSAIEFVYDDGGRLGAEFKGETGDCGTRAIAIAAEIPYGELYNCLKAAFESEPPPRRGERSHPRLGIYRESMNRFLQRIGWVWVPTMHVGQGCKVHLRTDELPNGRIIVRLSKHYAAVIDGVLHDTYDCSRDGTRCVYGYWTKER